MAMNKFTQLVLSWTTSKGRDTYGYNICRLDDRETGERFRCMGGGYDMVGTVFAQWLCANYQEKLLKIKDRAAYTFSKEHGNTPNNSPDTVFYGMRFYVDDNRIYIDGACGLDCVINIAEKIGLDVERDYIKKGVNRGRTIGWFISESINSEEV